MAEVFRGKSISMQGFERLVAIKRIHPNLVQNETFLRMFLDEARLSLSLVHANIVQVFDLGRSGDTYFIVMEYVDGTNLKSLTDSFRERNLVIPVPQAVYVMKEVCKGLAYAHQKRNLEGHHEGIVHRDISPPNILLSIEGEVKITDFGLAKAKSQVETTDPGVVKGKFGYLSPEAAYGQEVDIQADVFACGIVLWEMLAGRRLFQGKTDLETLEVVRRAEIPSLASLNPDVPSELEQICMRALARDKTKRYSSAPELGKDLSEFLFRQGMQITAYDTSTLVRQVLRFTRIEGFARSKSRVNQHLQQEVDRIIELERDDPGSSQRISNVRLQTGDHEVTVMEDPRTWEGVLDWGGEEFEGDFDFDPMSAAPGLTPIGVPKQPEPSLTVDSPPPPQPPLQEELPTPEPSVPPPTPPVAEDKDPFTHLPKTPSEKQGVDIFAGVEGAAPSAGARSSGTVVTPLVPKQAKALVIGSLVVLFVLGAILFWVVTTL